MNVQRTLIDWYHKHGRHDLPWRTTNDPYKILVSELMLQQTQVPRVIPAYKAFIKQFPTMKHLATAPRRDVLAAWQGLGYNNRATRLHALAVFLHAQKKSLPRTREELLTLPGIGPYTAGAIMIFAYNTPSLSIDVNVRRVLKRLFWTKRARPKNTDIEQQAQNILGRKPYDVQSALMDLGSSYCTARNPKCTFCPLAPLCKSRGVRPDEQQQQQPRFADSTRWWRGQILKRVLQSPVTRKQLFTTIKGDNKERFTAAVEKLIAEGLLTEQRGKLTIA